MTAKAKEPVREPIAHIAGNIHRSFLGEMKKLLPDLEIDRFFYPTLLIEEAEGILSQQELADKLKCDKVQVVRIIDYLSEKGYIERQQHPSDRRKNVLAVTEKARGRIPEIREAMKRADSAILNNLSADRVKVIYAALRKIEENLRVQG